MHAIFDHLGAPQHAVVEKKVNHHELKEESKKDPVSIPVKRGRKKKEVDGTPKAKRKHTWTEKNRKIFYEKCVPARLAALKAKKEAKAQASSTVEGDDPKISVSGSSSPSSSSDDGVSRRDV